MGNKLVRYNNTLHSLDFSLMTLKERGLFFSLCFFLKEKGTNEVTLSFNELREVVNFSKTDTESFIKLIRNTYRKLLKITLAEEDENQIEETTIFSKYKILKSEKMVILKLNKDFEHILNKLENNYTEHELLEYTSLKSDYSQLTYAFLKKWNTTKKVKISILDFREKLGVPNSYDTSNFNRQVLKPIMEELPQYFPNLKLEKIKTGKKVTSLKFTWNGKVEKIEHSQNDNVIDIIEISDKLNKSIEKAKKNRFIAPLLTIDNIEILVEMFQEKDLIKGLNWSYREIKQEIKSLNYLIKSIKTGMEQKEKKLVVKTVPEVVQEQETKEEILKENNLDLKKDQEIKITEIEKIKITKDEYEELYKKFLQEQNTEHNLLTRKGFDIANKNKYEIIEKANNIMKMENELSKITITKEKYELLYQNFIILNDCIDNQNTRESFDLLNKEKYKIVEQTITIPITMEDLDKVSFNEIEGKNIVVCSDEEDFRNNHIIVKEGELTKKIISISDIPEEKLLGKNNKKLVGGALIARLEKIARDEETKIQYKDKIIGE